MTSYKNKKQTMRERKLAMKQWLLSKTFRVGLIVVVATFGMVYVVQTSAMSTKGYDINTLQKIVRGLEQENQLLEVDIAQYRSMQYIQSQLQGMNLVAADTVTYITPAGTTVARR